MNTYYVRGLLLSVIYAIYSHTPAISCMEGSTALKERSEESVFICKRATETDVNELLELVSRQADSDDKTKLVVLPKNCRAAALAGAIAKERLFLVSLTSGKIIGTNKLFLLDDETERLAVIKDELRLCGENSQCTDTMEFITSLRDRKEFEQSIYCDMIGKFRLPFETVKNDMGFTIEGHFYCKLTSFRSLQARALVLYHGGAYVLPEYRGKAAYKALCTFSYDAIKEKVLAAIKAKSPEFLILVCGITRHNIETGHIEDDSGILRYIDRRDLIRKDFVAFVQRIETELLKETQPTPPSYMKSYHAFMPTFDPEAEQAVPLPDKQAIPGYGVMIVVPLFRFQKVEGIL